MAGYPQLELDRQLCFALYTASRAVVRAYAPLLEDAGLTYPQYVTMLVLWEDPDRPRSIGELGERLYLDSGWFKGMALNGVSPQPASQGARGRWQVWDFGQLPAGVAFTVWISWQANPTNPGRHPQDVALYDGGTQLMSVHRTLTVFP